MAIIGIGVDLVDIARFERALTRTPALRARLFAPDELEKDGRPRPTRSLAGRFAAKEALIKALGDSWAMRWHDMAVTGDEQGKPSFALSGAASDAAAALGARRVHVSMSHDAGMAIAVVVAED
jgi:holo-[acyl-carrier protein] synthase